MPKMGRGGRFGGGGRGLGEPPGEKSDLVSMRETKRAEVDDVLTVSKAVTDQYGSGAVVEQFQVAKFRKGSADDRGCIAYYDGANIAFNDRFFDGGKLDSAYDDCVRSGFHPSRGSKSGTEAVAAHEYGHALTAVAAERMGLNPRMGLDSAAARIVKESKTASGHTRVGDIAAAISGYARTSYAETIAEAFADVYCNGSRAKRESRAVVGAMNQYLT